MTALGLIALPGGGLGDALAAGAAGGLAGGAEDASGCELIQRRAVREYAGAPYLLASRPSRRARRG